MSLSDSSKAFHLAVYSAVLQIPHGKVCSYGHIAYLVSRPQNSRLVGYSLKHSDHILPQLDTTIPNLPWWRVVQSSGNIAIRDGDDRQASLLRQEGVVVERMKVDLDEFGWFPSEIDLDL